MRLNLTSCFIIIIEIDIKPMCHVIMKHESSRKIDIGMLY